MAEVPSGKPGHVLHGSRVAPARVEPAQISPSEREARRRDTLEREGEREQTNGREAEITEKQDWEHATEEPNNVTGQIPQIYFNLYLRDAFPLPNVVSSVWWKEGDPGAGENPLCVCFPLCSVESSWFGRLSCGDNGDLD